MMDLPAVHDRGGWPDAGPIERDGHVLEDWEYLADGVAQALGAKGLRSTDEMRRAIESFPRAEYEAMTYYERWVRANEALLVEKGLLTTEEIDRRVAELDTRWC
jgi:hypothetical protein